MKRQNVLKVLFLSLVLSSFASSCGLIEKWKTPEQPTDSKPVEAANTDSAKDQQTDDLFSKTMNDTKEETALNAGTDAPTNIATEQPEAKADVNDDLKSLEDEFSGNAPQEVAKNEVKEEPKNEIKEVKVEEALPEIKEETPPAITDNVNANENAGKVMSYKVKKGETLMQIAFKIYGDLSKWKNIKQMNGSKLGSNSALRSGMELKYTAPEKNFVWNPEGTPHLIRNGETLGTISNSVYQTPKKWKSIWENNRPLIKNPNVIFAGFTLYCKKDMVANYVQPKTDIEDVKIDQAIADQEEASFEKQAQNENEIDLTKEVQSAPTREATETNNQEEAEN